jgi:hypothetical protein
MRKAAIWSLPILLLGLLSLRAVGQQPNNTPMSFTGEIMDNECAAAGSHTDMMQKEGFKTAKDCALGCVKAGGQFVLFGLNKTTRRSRETCRLRGPEGDSHRHLRWRHKNNSRSIHTVGSIMHGCRNLSKLIN